VDSVVNRSPSTDDPGFPAKQIIRKSNKKQRTSPNNRLPQTAKWHKKQTNNDRTKSNVFQSFDVARLACSKTKKHQSRKTAERGPAVSGKTKTKKRADLMNDEVQLWPQLSATNQYIVEETDRRIDGLTASKWTLFYKLRLVAFCPLSFATGNWRGQTKKTTKMQGAWTKGGIAGSSTLQHEAKIREHLFPAKTGEEQSEKMNNPTEPQQKITQSTSWRTPKLNLWDLCSFATTEANHWTKSNPWVSDPWGAISPGTEVASELLKMDRNNPNSFCRIFGRSSPEVCK
jgi:hypothetical protein